MTVSDYPVAAPRVGRAPLRRQLGQASLVVVLVAVGLLMLSPFFWVFAVSFEPNSDQFSLPPKWIPSPISFDSYQQLFDQLPYGTQLLNSVVVTLAVVIGSTVLSVLSAYVFARLRFPGRDLLFTVFLIAFMIPTQVAAVPEFLVVKQLGLMNTILSVILPALIQIFGIFLLRQHFLSIPRELEEAAKLDGASRLRFLVSIIVPMSWPAISCVAILTGQYIWNDFFWPNLFLSNPLAQTAPVGLVSMQNSLAGSPAGSVFAGITLLTLPIVVVFAFLQRQLTRSLSYAGVQR